MLIKKGKVRTKNIRRIRDNKKAEAEANFEGRMIYLRNPNPINNLERLEEV